ncbi:beta-N-acetylhexosaminidase OS=Streptomyces tendae OX=1932 GN=GUR47_14660 PE=3 SV=1 [Streptomyces tendae]
MPRIDVGADVLAVARHLVPSARPSRPGSRAVMSAHILSRPWMWYCPATLSRRILTDLLRGELGYEGSSSPTASR